MECGYSVVVHRKPIQVSSSTPKSSPLDETTNSWFLAFSPVPLNSQKLNCLTEVYTFSPACQIRLCELHTPSEQPFWRESDATLLEKLAEKAPTVEQGSKATLYG